MMKWLMLVIVVAAQVGCGKVLFRDSFNADTPGSPPNDTPPGSPTGDSIYWNAPGNESLRVVSSLDDKAVRYRKQPDIHYQRYVGFLSREITPGVRRFTASWIGRATLGQDDGPLDIWLGSPHFSSMAAIRLENGRVLRRATNGTYVDVGSLPNGVRHAVYWTVDRDAETNTISIVGDDGILASYLAQPVLDDDAMQTSRPTIWLWFSEGEGGRSSYTMDDVRIAEGVEYHDN